MDQVKFVEDLSRPYPFKFFKAVFHKFYLVHSWILCPIWSEEKVLYRKHEYCMLSAMDSDELKNGKVEKKKLESELKTAENDRLRQKRFRDERTQKLLFLGEKTQMII